ncbi:MAG: ribonuclease E activity regulator RraA [Chloroflexaceae bacterium]|nr:ribonuclease E activity regulator RraA [Chloroflexaceae bacterium]
MSFKTADLCDHFAHAIQVPTPLFQNYGGMMTFAGRIATVEVFEDNVLVREMLERDGKGHVLVIDGGGSLRCALIGYNLAMLAFQNGWNGIVIYGCIRDSQQIVQVAVGVRALNTNPARSNKGGAGAQNVMVTFAGATFRPGYYLYADEDGMIVSEFSLI